MYWMALRDAIMIQLFYDLWINYYYSVTWIRYPDDSDNTWRGYPNLVFSKQFSCVFTV